MYIDNVCTFVNTCSTGDWNPDYISKNLNADFQSHFETSENIVIYETEWILNAIYIQSLFESHSRRCLIIWCFKQKHIRALTFVKYSNNSLLSGWNETYISLYVPCFVFQLLLVTLHAFNETQNRRFTLCHCRCSLNDYG